MPELRPARLLSTSPSDQSLRYLGNAPPPRFARRAPRRAAASRQQGLTSLGLTGDARVHDSLNYASSGDRARNTFFLLDQAQILSYQVQRTCQPACQSTRCWFIRFSHIRDVIRCVEKQRCCFHFRICTRCTRKAKGSATINHLCNMRRCL